MRKMTFSLPFLPPSLNVYRNDHWRKQRGEEKTWKDYIAVKWAEMGRPKLKTVRIAMIFSFPNRRTRDLDNYLATGSKLVGDAIKGLFIPDDNPEHLTAWSFRFEFGEEAKTIVVIEEADRKGEDGVSGGRAAFWEDSPARARKTIAFPGDDSERPAGKPSSREHLPYRQAMEPGLPSAALLAPSMRPATPRCVPWTGAVLNGIWYPDEEICRSRPMAIFPG
jgi:Holliday junction resolvase RusA-like endonuclease